MQHLTQTLAGSMRLLFPLLILALSACTDGGSGGGGAAVGGSGDAGTGSVGILLTDDPSSEFSKIWITVREVRLLGDSGQVTIFSGNRRVNLLALRDTTEIFALGRRVPAGIYSKIRLLVDRVELERPDGSFEDADLPANGKIDLNPRMSFVVARGSLLLIRLDVDGNKSIHLHETGNGRYKFRPVVFVDIITGRVPSRLVHLSGVVSNLDLARRTFQLCRTHPVSFPQPRSGDRTTVSAQSHPTDDDHDGDGNGDGDDFCVYVRTDGDTSVFDIDGMPARLGVLSNGDEASVLGRFRAEGEKLLLDAEVIQQGGPATVFSLRGVARSDVVDDVFDFSIDPGQRVTSDELVEVALQKGTKIFDRRGVEVGPEAIADGVPTGVVGVLELITGEPDRIWATVIFVDTDAKRDERVAGLVVGYDPGDRELTVNAGDAGFVCVLLEPGARVVLVGRDSVDLIDPEELARGQRVSAFGADDGRGCFVTDTVVALADGV